MLYQLSYAHRRVNVCSLRQFEFTEKGCGAGKLNDGGVDHDLAGCGAERGELLFAANRTVLQLVILDRHFEHVVAPDADAMDLLASPLGRRRRLLRSRLLCAVSGSRRNRFSHARIVTCPEFR